MNLNNTKKNISHSSLITSAVSLVLLATTSVTNATQSKSPPKNISQEQCASLVKAGLNDCASVEHACAGLNTEDAYESDWLWLPAGTCAKISGAHVLRIDGKTEK